MAFIYALTEPGTHKVFYIGYATHPERRLLSHIKDGRDCIVGNEIFVREKSTSRKIVGIAAMLIDGTTPGLMLLNECECHEKAFWEAFWGEIYGTIGGLLNDKPFNRNVVPVR